MCEVYLWVWKTQRKWRQWCWCCWCCVSFSSHLKLLIATFVSTASILLWPATVETFAWGYVTKPEVRYDAVKVIVDKIAWNNLGRGGIATHSCRRTHSRCSQQFHRICAVDQPTSRLCNKRHLDWFTHFCRLMLHLPYTLPLHCPFPQILPFSVGGRI